MENKELEKRIEFLENIVKKMIGESAWNYYLNRTPIRNSANNISDQNKGSMN